MADKVVSVYIVDDHPLFRAGLRVGLAQDPRIEVIGESGDAFEAVDAIRNQPPDVLLVDMEMPVLSGVSIIGLLRQSYPDMIMIVLSGHRDATYVVGAMEAGANGYLLKNIDTAHLAEVIQGFAERHEVISPYLINLTIEIPAGPSQAAQTADEREHVPPLLANLSPREHEVLELMIAGRSNKDIARLLHVSVETVKTHVHNILSKLQVRNRAEAIALASRQARFSEF